MNISDVPEMPDVTFDAIVIPQDILADVTFQWYLDMTFTQHNRNDQHRVPETGTIDIQGDGSWAPNWRNLFAGGNLVVHVKASIRGVEAEDKQEGYKIKGNNPANAIVNSELGGSPATNIACWESGHTLDQFGGDQWPLFGAPNGWGIMQIDNPPAQCPLDENVIWNWKTNVGMGLCVIGQKERDARGYPGRIRRLGYPNATDFTDDQLLNETIQRYNGGSYWTWGEMFVPSRGKQWIATPPNNYVANVLSATCP
jgi:hypothetical protein